MMLTMNRTAVDRMEKIYSRLIDEEKDFAKDIATYLKEGDFPLEELEFTFRMGDEKDTTYRAQPGNEKLNTMQNKAKNEKAWRIVFVIAEMYRSVAAEQGRFFAQDSGDAWYYTDLHYNAGTYMVPYAILSLVMGLVKDKWDTKEIQNVDRKRKKKESVAQEASETEEEPQEVLAGYEEEADEDETEAETEEE